jgi:hypothetical protein
MSELWAHCASCEHTFSVAAHERRPAPPLCPLCLRSVSKTALGASPDIAQRLLAMT